MKNQGPSGAIHGKSPTGPRFFFLWTIQRGGLGLALERGGDLSQRERPPPFFLAALWGLIWPRRRFFLKKILGPAHRWLCILANWRQGARATAAFTSLKTYEHELMFLEGGRAGLLERDPGASYGTKQVMGRLLTAGGQGPKRGCPGGQLMWAQATPQGSWRPKAFACHHGAPASNSVYPTAPPMGGWANPGTPGHDTAFRVLVMVLTIIMGQDFLVVWKKTSQGLLFATPPNHIGGGPRGGAPLGFF